MKTGRWLPLVIPPVAFGITGVLHLAAAGGGPRAGGEFQQIMRHADLWITIHIVQIVIICLLGGTVLVLARGFGPARRRWPGSRWCPSPLSTPPSTRWRG